MKVRNTSSKIISVGKNLLLPDEEITLPKELNNESVMALERLKQVQIIEDAKPEKAEKAEKVPATEKKPTAKKATTKKVKKEEEAK